MVRRAPILRLKKWQWLLFDLVFKPLAVGVVLLLERWFSHILPTISTDGEAQIKAAGRAGISLWGKGVATFSMVKLISLWVHFCELDNAYRVFFQTWLKFYKEEKQRW